MIETFYALQPYALEKDEKQRLLTNELKELTQYHYEHCQYYKNYLDAIGFQVEQIKSPEDIPFFPVRLFKELELLSIPRSKIFKTMTSSGTVGQAVSKVFVDKSTALSQQKVMVKILSDFVGSRRLPMLIIDSPGVVKNRSLFSARGAAIMGLNIMATQTVYTLDEEMKLNVAVLKEFMEKNSGKQFIIFGFTFMIWEHFYQELKKMEITFDMSQAYLLQSGGWKKLESLAVTREVFKKSIQEVCGITHYVDHYGMIEQTGCIYAECEYGHYHASIYSDVIVRHHEDFSPCKIGEEGIVQVMSVLPHSYPGHALLTEDIGMIVGEDDCPCGRKGKYVKILGRMKSAELRGCSDTYATKFR